MTLKELTVRQELPAAVANAACVWAKATTSSDSECFTDMVRDKSRAVVDFFDTTGQRSQTAAPGDVERWLEDMRERGLATWTVYAMASFVSSFYTWLLTNEQLAQALPYGNIASQVRPKVPKAYKGAKTLTDDELTAFLDVVRIEAKYKLTARRDFAMLLFYILTGHRREEVARLTTTLRPA